MPELVPIAGWCHTASRGHHLETVVY